MKQKTIGSSFVLEGKGLHTGLDLKLKACPAPANHGIKIKRTDLPNTAAIDALAEKVGNTVRGTVLKEGEVVVSTIEHALAVFYAMGIDNCLFEVDGPEFPILDGSSIRFLEQVERVGIVEQEADKDFIFIDKRIEYHNETDSWIVAEPSDRMELIVEIGFHSPVLKAQKAKLKDMSLFPTEIAGARTFVFVREIEPLINMNLIKGGDLKNAIVIYDKLMSQDAIDNLTEKLHQPRMDASTLGYLSGPLKFDNEPARHKLLDLIGDLALAGKPLKGRITAHYPGHKINTEFAKLLRDKYILNNER